MTRLIPLVGLTFRAYRRQGLCSTTWLTIWGNRSVQARQYASAAPDSPEDAKRTRNIGIIAHIDAVSLLKKIKYVCSPIVLGLTALGQNHYYRADALL